MRRYIHGERDGIHVIDLLQTEQLLGQARDFCADVAGRGGKILFVGTKKQARDSIERWAEETGMPYVSRRWLGGLLTNFSTIKDRIKRLHELDELKKEGQLDLLPTKERMARELEKESELSDASIDAFIAHAVTVLNVELTVVTDGTEAHALGVLLASPRSANRRQSRQSS